MAAYDKHKHSRIKRMAIIIFTSSFIYYLKINVSLLFSIYENCGRKNQLRMLYTGFFCYCLFIDFFSFRGNSTLKYGRFSFIGINYLVLVHTIFNSNSNYKQVAELLATDAIQSIHCSNY